MDDMIITIEFTDKGAYMTIKNPVENSFYLKELILQNISDKKLRNVDIAAVERLLNSADSYRRERISADISPFIKDEEISLEVTENALKGYIYFTPPSVGGYYLSESQIKSFLDNKGIVYGIKKDVLNDIVKARDYGYKYLIAEGDAAINGMDGKVDFLFDNSDKKLKPVILDNGNADYYNVENFEIAKNGQVLVTMTKATLGIDGKDIYGKVIRAVNGVPVRPVRAGKNVVFDEKANQLAATCDGQIIYLDNRISVTQEMKINGDVGLNTGNISFGGTVDIFGNVSKEHKVIAEGNVKISGTNDGVLIDSGGGILINGGIPGTGATLLKALGNVSARFISNANVFAGGNVYTDSIVCSEVKCKGDVEVNGRKGAIVGGKVFAGKNISARFIGSPSGTSTEVYAGLDYEIYLEYMDMKREYDKLIGELERIDKNIQYMESQKLTEYFTDDMEKKLKSFRQNGKSLKFKLNKMKHSMKNSVAELRNSKFSGEIAVPGAIYPGVRIQIGNAVLIIQNEIRNCVCENINGSITVNFLGK